MKKETFILVVDDNRMDIELALDAFREARLVNRIETVESGREALDYLFGLQRFSDRQRFPLPDLILLDLKMSGFDVLKQIKNTPIIKRIPVVILTSSCEDDDRALCYDLGANSYLVKTASFSGFIETIKQIEHYWLHLNVGPSLETLADPEKCHADD